MLLSAGLEWEIGGIGHYYHKCNVIHNLCSFLKTIQPHLQIDLFFLQKNENE